MDKFWLQMICWVLVVYPKFVKKYANINRVIEKAVKKYTRDVKLSKFPSNKNFLNGSKFR